MQHRTSRAAKWASVLLAIAGLALLTIWAFSLASYGYWVDEHQAVGAARPVDYVLFVSGVVLIAASLATIILRRKMTRSSKNP